MTSAQQDSYYGKYRGQVVSNIDPLFLGRLMVSVPTIEAVTNTWAMPCVPYAGQNVGFYAMPPIGADVWVEFEAGDPAYPIWSGCFWSPAQLPTGPLGPPTPFNKILKTESTNLVLDDTPAGGGVTLEVSPPAVTTPITMKFSSTGVEITCLTTKITMTIQDIEMTAVPSIVKLTPLNIQATIPPAGLTLAPESIKAELTDKQIEASLAGVAVEAEQGNLTGKGLMVHIQSTANTEVKAGGNLGLSSAGNTSISATDNLDASALANASVSGLQASVEGKTQALVKSNAMTSIESSGITEVKGSLVKIN
ncbi:MAG TPA: phage baseplate assembly protein V [Dehalococcoidia bacterium]|nr:phage baseplate assembly protein V [Dehalococcoidia bacterium]